MLYAELKDRARSDKIRLPVPAPPEPWCDPVEVDSLLSCLPDRGGGAQGVRTSRPSRLLWEVN